MKKQLKRKLLTFFYSAEGMSSFSALVNPSGRLLTGCPTPDITIIFWPACRALGILTIFYAVLCLDLKGRGHKIEFKYFSEIGTSTGFNILKLLLWWATAIVIFCFVKLKTYWSHWMIAIYCIPLTKYFWKGCKHLWEPRVVFFIFTLINFHGQANILEY